MADCRNCEDRAACVPFFVHENDMMHSNRQNKRMLIALIVSILVVTIGMFSLGCMFLNAYNERERGWQEIVQQRLSEVENGVHQQQDP